MGQRELAGNPADGVGYGSPVPSSRRATGSNRSRRQDPKSPEAIKAALLRYRVMAYIVGVGLIILVFVGVPLQYGAHEPQVVSVVGPIHGFLYMVYLVSGADLARRGRWTLKQVLGVVAAGFLPFLAFIMEHYVTRRVLGEMETASQG
ncbi:MAG: DUF3817 domain-containing protein [Actinobacteria bacterium]|nr:DUF3817 domain-containing protein [Actinomycetota bacterium]MCL5446481.1 DUF3817 domain-containing protein [Actinomycetota bacterium]